MGKTASPVGPIQRESQRVGISFNDAVTGFRLQNWSLINTEKWAGRSGTSRIFRTGHQTCLLSPGLGPRPVSSTGSRLDIRGPARSRRDAGLRFSELGDGSASREDL